MQKFKKILTCVVAGMCMFIGANSVVTAANTEFVCGDVNNDGNIGMADLIALEKYVAGSQELENYAAADTNDNKVIDIIDTWILQAYIIESISSLPYKG
ncbi:MAG: dockerin type I repeat-containing protein [Ruminococcus sp.]|nr:dockerin type I repeat-containing protein [Ruminococcus sp.]